MKAAYAIIGIVVVLFAAALIIPSNSLTGNIIKEEPCNKLGCVQLCDQDAANATQCGDPKEGLVCCPTQWQSGVCDYQVNCEKIREYSLYQTLETYQDSVREQPTQVDIGFQRFILPLAICFAIIVYFMLKRKDPELPKN